MYSKTYYTATCDVCGEDTQGHERCQVCARALRMGAAALQPFHWYVTEHDPWDGSPALLLRRAYDHKLAHDEGRLSPSAAAAMDLPIPAHQCGTCGMHHHARSGAADCCRDMVEASEDERMRLRVEQKWTLA
jgi:hypothetical protein